MASLLFSFLSISFISLLLLPQMLFFFILSSSVSFSFFFLSPSYLSLFPNLFIFISFFYSSFFSFPDFCKSYRCFCVYYGKLTKTYKFFGNKFYWIYRINKMLYILLLLCQTLSSVCSSFLISSLSFILFCIFLSSSSFYIFSHFIFSFSALLSFTFPFSILYFLFPRFLILQIIRKRNWKMYRNEKIIKQNYIVFFDFFCNVWGLRD